MSTYSPEVQAELDHREQFVSNVFQDGNKQEMVAEIAYLVAWEINPLSVMDWFQNTYEYLQADATLTWAEWQAYIVETATTELQVHAIEKESHAGLRDIIFAYLKSEHERLSKLVEQGKLEKDDMRSIVSSGVETSDVVPSSLEILAFIDGEQDENN